MASAIRSGWTRNVPESILAFTSATRAVSTGLLAAMSRAMPEASLDNAASGRLATEGLGSFAVREPSAAPGTCNGAGLLLLIPSTMFRPDSVHDDRPLPAKCWPDL